MVISTFINLMKCTKTSLGPFATQFLCHLPVLGHIPFLLPFSGKTHFSFCLFMHRPAICISQILHMLILWNVSRYFCCAFTEISLTCANGFALFFCYRGRHHQLHLVHIWFRLSFGHILLCSQTWPQFYSSVFCQRESGWSISQSGIWDMLWRGFSVL